MKTLLELADACEKASRPTHKMMWDCYDAVFGKSNAVPIDRFPGHKMPDTWNRFASLLRAEAYLDAAMTLVPGGKRFSCGMGFAAHGPWARIEPDGDCRVGSPAHKQGIANRYAATPALALCSAALRARAASSGGSNA